MLPTPAPPRKGHRQPNAISRDRHLGIWVQTYHKHLVSHQCPLRAILKAGIIRHNHANPNRSYAPLLLLPTPIDLFHLFSRKVLYWPLVRPSGMTCLWMISITILP